MEEHEDQQRLAVAIMIEPVAGERLYRVGWGQEDAIEQVLHDCDTDRENIAAFTVGEGFDGEIALAAENIIYHVDEIGMYAASPPIHELLYMLVGKTLDFGIELGRGMQTKEGTEEK